jgi:hypothetical protein
MNKNLNSNSIMKGEYESYRTFEQRKYFIKLLNSKTNYTSIDKITLSYIFVNMLNLNCQYESDIEKIIKNIINNK